MEKVDSFEKVIDTAPASFNGWELCALAEATYDPAQSMLHMELDSCVRSSEGPGFRQPWLPPPTKLTRQVVWSRARHTAQSMFQRWTRKVSRSVPTLKKPSRD